MSCVGCSVLNCFNNKVDTPDKQFHFFPKNENLCQIWIEKTNPALKNKPISCIRGYLICSDHFELCHYTTPDKVKLNRGSIPTLKLPKFSDHIEDVDSYEEQEIEKVICQNIENEYTSQLLLGIKTEQLEFDKITCPKMEDLYTTQIFSDDNIVPQELDKLTCSKKEDLYTTQIFSDDTIGIY